MGVGSQYGGDAAVEIPAESGLFAGGFGVEVEEDDLGVGVALDQGEEFVGFAEGIVAGGHEDATLEVDDGVGGAVGELAFVGTEAGCAVGVVAGAEDAAATLVRAGRDGHVLEDLFLVPDVVAGGDDLGTEVEDFFGDGGRDAEAAGGVLAVDDEEIDGVGFHNVGEMFADDVAAGRTEDVADEENVHRMSLSRVKKQIPRGEGQKKKQVQKPVLRWVKEDNLKGR